MTPSSPLFAEMQEHLTDHAIRLRREATRETLIRAFERSSLVLLAISLIGLAIAFLLLFTPLGWAIAGRIAIASFSLAYVVWMAWLVGRIWRSSRAPLDLRGTAERLDTKAGQFNRIATAFDLAQSTTADHAFATRAIHEGAALLRRSFDIEMPGAVMPRRHSIWMAAASILVAGVAMWVATKDQVSVHVADSGQPLAVRVDDEHADETAVAATTKPSMIAQPVVLQSATVASTMQAGRAATSISHPSASKSETAARSSFASPASGGTASSPSDTSRADPDAAKATSPAEITAAKDDVSRRQTSSSNRGNGATPNSQETGSGGSGGASPPQQRSAESNAADKPAASLASADAATASQDAAADAADAERGSESSASDQPLRQDRSPPGTRELGQSGTEGGQGNGRGGPGDVKKTRGAGAVFLSVPLPDFVPAPIGEGPSRVTERQVPPMPSDIARPDSRIANSPAAQENVVRRFDVTPADAGLVSRFLERLREQDAPTPTETHPEGAVSP